MTQHIKKHIWVLLLGFMLAACSSESPSPANDNPSNPSDEQSAQVPASPEPGTSRDGIIYDVSIVAPKTGDTVVFTVHEPQNFEGGKKYPLVFHGHGVQGSRQKSCLPISTGNIDLQNPIGSDFINVCAFTENGYGAVSIDQRAHGLSTGTMRAMDPDFEGQNMLAMLDWLEENLDWLAYGPSADGTDPNNLLLGTVGGSYGGLFQYLLNNIDPENRVDAMIPEYAPYDLVYSLGSNDVLKSTWNVFLIATINLTGIQTLSPADPWLDQQIVQSLLDNKFTNPLKEFLTYHSPRYFCEGINVTQNGDLGGETLIPEHAPIPGPPVNALVWQSSRDNIFNLNDGYRNFQCLQQRGGDVRYFTYQRGHNALPVTQDIGGLLYPSFLNMMTTDCGGTDVESASIAFFDRYLKGIPDAIDDLPQGPCLSLTGGDSILVDELTTGRQGTEFEVPTSYVVAGLPNVPTVVELGMTAGDEGEVLAGIPHLELEVNPVLPGMPGEPIIFAGLGHIKANRPETQLLPDLIDNQWTPIRGTGFHDLEMVGALERLEPGDQLVLMLTGGDLNQYGFTGSLNLAQPTLLPVNVAGKVWAPLLGPLAPVTEE